jgi:hypothetical protein
MDAVEQQQRNAIVPGIDALYVSCSSQNIAPSTAKLLRNSGLFPPPQQNKCNTTRPTEGGHGNDEEEDDLPIRDNSNNDNNNNNSNNEFRLKFQWMRPHPSLAFALEETLSLVTKNADGSGDDNNNKESKGDANNNDNNNTPWKGGTNVDPAIESTRLMDAYRSSQMITNITKQQQQQQQQQQDCNVATNQDNDNTKDSKNKKSLNKTAGTDTTKFSIPLELPTLCINLTDLIDPPLMTSWLPGENYDISCDDSDEDQGGQISE